MQLPVRFGKYELQEFLGGGMSHVYRSLDTVIGRQVAVKILTDGANSDADAKERFLHEARMSGTIQHDHIVTIHDYGEEHGRPYIVMEFLRGRDLRDTIRHGQAGDLLNRLRIAREVAEALDFVHQRGIIHRDIKPENIFVEESGRSKLMDFGISKAAGLSLTRAGNTMGTPYYMAPEQVMGVNVTPLVDIYSFGIVLYELLSGQRMVQGDSMERLFYIVLHENPDPAPLRAAGIPESCIDLVMRCTAKKPEDRLQSFGAVRQVLTGIISELQSPASARPAPPAGPQPPHPTNYGAQNQAPAPSQIRMGPVIITAVTTIILSAIGLYYFMGGAKKQDDRKKEEPKKEELAARLAAKGGDLILVPRGEFKFGSASSPMRAETFYIDRTEVSNKSYADFAAASGHSLPEGFPADQPDLPVVNVTFDDAKEFCLWAGKRLPSEWEWEKAARGTDGRDFPWGSTAEAGKAVVSDSATGRPKGPVPVNSMENTASPSGALHMAGNVWEWIERPHTPSAMAVESFGRVLKPPPTANEPWHYIKGGAFDRTLKEAVLYEWSSVPGRLQSPSIGFRCAADPPGK